ncbi:hypothetical protein C8J57DRAFT_1528751 [Mycena rebaudengoi]|nr:hypothetical protein C8J57DRAFT_1528751 [Mycena rebaudengoi]
MSVFEVSPPLKNAMADSSPLTSLTSGDVTDKKGKRRDRDTRRPVQLGMENGYALSLMAALRIEYHQEADSDNSLFVQSKMLIGKKNLEVSDVLDRGVNLLNVTVAPFCVEIGLGMRVDSTVKDMQLLLTKAASLVKGRNNCFLVDPHNLLMGCLRGAGLLEELSIAWSVLNVRMSLAQKNFEKYDVEYKAETTEELLLSPVSTNAEIYSRLLELRMNMEHLTYIHKELAHHGDLVPDDFHDSQFPYLPNWLPASKALKEAFPSREAEVRPALIYYNPDTGERTERAPPARSSWGAGDDFQPPDPMEESERSRKAHRMGGHWQDHRQYMGERLGSVREEPGAESDYSHTRVERDAFASASTVNSYAFLGTDTPYKSAREFFVPRSPIGAHHTHAVPGYPAPNPLFGLASASPYGFGNRYVQMGGATEGQEGMHRQATVIPKKETLVTMQMDMKETVLVEANEVVEPVEVLPMDEDLTASQEEDHQEVEEEASPEVMEGVSQAVQTVAIQAFPVAAAVEDSPAVARVVAAEEALRAHLGELRPLLHTGLSFEQQAFRQEGHNRETPQMFINRRIRYTRMLANSDDGGPLEVFLVMRKAPIRWSTILVMENINSSEELYDKVNEHDESLIDAA